MNNTKIVICPVKGLYRLLAEGNPGRCAALISSAAPVEERKLEKISYVFRQYEDLDYDCPGRSFSREDAVAFVRFLRSLDGVDTLYCCCDAGESRSPAVAAAVSRWFGLDEMPIWRNPHYHPNMLVYELLSAALGVGVSDEEMDLRIYENRRAFRSAIRNT